MTKLKSFFMLTALVGSIAHAGNAYKRVEMENQIRARVSAIVEKADKLALVQVSVNLKQVQTTNLPVVGFGAEVTPVEFDGELGASSIESIAIRVITQVPTLPDWVRKEVDSAVKSRDVKVNVKFEKAGGALIADGSELPKIAKEASDVFIKGVEGFRTGAWFAIFGMLAGLIVIAAAVFLTSGRFESALGRLIDAKLAPLLQAMNVKSGGARESSREREAGAGASAAAQNVANQSVTGASKELADLPIEAVLTLFSDCYWTKNDGYAHYLWTQTSQEQREKILASNVIDNDYFWFVRDFAAENQGYHLDARYLSAPVEFRNVDQAQLLEWTRANRTSYRLVSPMRFEALELSLAERIEFMKQADLQSAGPRAKIVFAKQGQRRRLPAKLTVKTLAPSDEQYLWDNAGEIPANLRPALKSLVWLALAPNDYVSSIFSDLDARAIASAWIGPEAALNKLAQALPAKKLEMVNHILKTDAASRDSETFEYLAQAGASAPEVQADVASNAGSTENVA